VDLRAGLDAIEQEMSCLCWESKHDSPVVQVIAKSLYRLNYHGFISNELAKAPFAVGKSYLKTSGVNQLLRAELDIRGIMVRFPVGAGNFTLLQNVQSYLDSH